MMISTLGSLALIPAPQPTDTDLYPGDFVEVRVAADQGCDDTMMREHGIQPGRPLWAQINRLSGEQLSLVARDYYFPADRRHVFAVEA